MTRRALMRWFNLGQVKVLRLEPDDILVVELSRPIPREDAADLREQLAAEFPDIRVIIVADGSLKVVRP